METRLYNFFLKRRKILGHSARDVSFDERIKTKGPLKLMQRVKIAHSFLQSVLNLFHFIILSLPIWFYISLSKNFSKPTSKDREIGRFDRSLLMESF